MTYDYSANVQASQDAEEIIAFIGEKPHRFWELIAEHARAELPAKPSPVDRLPAMTEQEATRFEAETFPYGKHLHEYVGEVDCSYILFLTEGDEFSRRLKRYVKSQRFQDRQGDE